MSKPDFDIQNFVFLDHESLGFPGDHARALEMFESSVVRPSLLALDGEIEANARRESPGSEFLASDLADLFQATVEGYLLTVQAMWERGLRSLLVGREVRLCGGAEANALRRATWSSGPRSLQAHFERLLGIPVAAFDSYEDLNLLQNLGNAIRHGDGPSAERVHDLAPSLWMNWIAPGETVLAGLFVVTARPDSPKHPSFNSVTLREAVLEQMIHSVTGFWNDLEFMRCNSFKRKHESTVRQLETWSEERLHRASRRVWTPV